MGAKSKLWRNVGTSPKKIKRWLSLKVTPRVSTQGFIKKKKKEKLYPN